MMHKDVHAYSPTVLYAPRNITHPCENNPTEIDTVNKHTHESTRRYKKSPAGAPVVSMRRGVCVYHDFNMRRKTSKNKQKVRTK